MKQSVLEKKEKLVDAVTLKEPTNEMRDCQVVVLLYFIYVVSGRDYWFARDIYTTLCLHSLSVF